MRDGVGYRWVIPGSLALGAATMIGLYFTTSPHLAAHLQAAGIAGPIAEGAGLAAPFGIAGLILMGCVGYTAWLLRVEPDPSPA